MIEPYYADDRVTLYHGRFEDLRHAGVSVTLAQTPHLSAFCALTGEVSLHPATTAPDEARRSGGVVMSRPGPGGRCDATAAR